MRKHMIMLSGGTRFQYTHTHTHNIHKCMCRLCVFLNEIFVTFPHSDISYTFSRSSHELRVMILKEKKIERTRASVSAFSMITMINTFGVSSVRTCICAKMYTGLFYIYSPYVVPHTLLNNILRLSVIAQPHLRIHEYYTIL